MKYCSSSYQNLLSIFWRLLFLCWSVLIDNSSKNIFSLVLFAHVMHSVLLYKGYLYLALVQLHLSIQFILKNCCLAVMREFLGKNLPIVLTLKIYFIT